LGTDDLKALATDRKIYTPKMITNSNNEMMERFSNL